MYLIQGFFQQEHMGMGIGFVAGEGAVATIRSGLIWMMFAGVIFHRDNDASQPLTGAMHDEFGYSELSDIVVTKTKVRFLKHYLQGNGERYSGSSIAYVFRLTKKGNMWIGHYRFTPQDDSAKGVARCVITEVDNAFLPNRQKALVGK